MKILLTGGGRGIGQATLAALLARFPDCRVWVLGLSAPSVGDADRSRVLFSKVDLTDLAAAAETIQRVVAEADGVDVAINNAGVGQFGSVEDFPLEAWNRLMALNVTVPFLLFRACLPGMKARKRGRIISISSDADEKGFPGAAAYCASKHALKGMVKALRLEVKGSEIGLSIVAPGRVDTYFNGKSPGQRPHALQPADVAATIVHIIEMPARCQVSTVEMESVLE